MKGGPQRLLCTVLAGPVYLGQAIALMRATGTLLTILALVAVQAPWIACACDGDAGIVPVLASLAHGDVDDGHAGHAHAGHCCDHAAHLMHGAAHRHGAHCHDGQEHDGDAPERHDGFSLPVASMPGGVSLDAHHAIPAIFTTLDDAAMLPVATQATTLRDAGPPEPRLEPGVTTERLLL